ncbi:MAG: RNA polymerase-binding protein DksA [bacterium]
MKRERKTLFTEKLNGMLEELEQEVSSTVDGMRQDGIAFPDPTDRASLEAERNLTLRIRDRERKLRNKIEEAMARLEEGTFGICEVCEEKIGFKRLEARPVTTLCINCKEEQEEDEEKHQAG